MRTALNRSPCPDCRHLAGSCQSQLPSPSSWKPITDYVDQQFEQYFRDESGLNRKNIQDNRVHCCLYFISPFGHGCVAVQAPGIGVDVPTTASLPPPPTVPLLPPLQIEASGRRLHEGAAREGEHRSTHRQS